MSVETQTKPATIEDLYRVMSDEGTYELIDGKLMYMAPTGYGHTRTSARIRDALLRYEEETHAGYALADGIGFLVKLPHRQSFSPDASLSATEPDDDENFIDGAPIFAAEIRSKNDHGPAGDAAAMAKRDDYFAAGTLAVWDVNPRARTITRYTPDTMNTPKVFHAGDIADAEPALPDWRVPVDDIFGKNATVTRPS